ncbi:hypothetical protein VNO78_08177 [Psophocarpus tetragonolobus]|uniref:Uncharacterized protein n=1 Tax=Psophocarpus tetragonolobus TaxID=3891 RepID=A0AAN9SXE5_PSOTE
MDPPNIIDPLELNLPKLFSQPEVPQWSRKTNSTLLGSNKLQLIQNSFLSVFSSSTFLTLISFDSHSFNIIEGKTQDAIVSRVDDGTKLILEMLVMFYSQGVASFGVSEFRDKLGHHTVKLGKETSNQMT